MFICATFNKSQTKVQLSIEGKNSLHWPSSRAQVSLFTEQQKLSLQDLGKPSLDCFSFHFFKTWCTFSNCFSDDLTEACISALSRNAAWRHSSCSSCSQSTTFGRYFCSNLTGADPYRFTETGQIFQKTQKPRKGNFRELKSKTIPVEHVPEPTGGLHLWRSLFRNQSPFFLDPRLIKLHKWSLQEWLH